MLSLYIIGNAVKSTNFERKESEIMLGFCTTLASIGALGYATKKFHDCFAENQTAEAN